MIAAIIVLASLLYLVIGLFAGKLAAEELMLDGDDFDEMVIMAFIVLLWPAWIGMGILAGIGWLFTRLLGR